MATEKSVMAVIRSSRPTFRSDSDKLAFAVHAFFVSSGLVLVSTGPPAFSDSALSESSNTDEVGIEGWNEGKDEYAFVYVDPEKKNRKVLVKCLVMGEKLLVDAVSDGFEPAHLEINIDEYVAENAGNNYNTLYKNLGKLISSLESEILSRLDGSTKSTSRSSPSSSTPPAAEFVITEQRPRNLPQGGVIPPAIPLGGSDLYPGPGAGMYPSRGFGGGGGMLLGPDDPSWFEGRGRRPGFPGGPNVPPGARFDPYGPPGVPGFEPGRFTRGPRRPPGATHPDLQHFGSGDDADYI
ncbi:putative proteasome inhibitor [Drosera capensis]